MRKIIGYKIHASGFVDYVFQDGERKVGGMVYPGDEEKLYDVFDEFTADYIKFSVWTKKVLDNYDEAVALLNEG